MKRLKVFSWILFIALVVVIALNHQTVYDIFRGMIYSPSLEMAEIRENLNLNSRGVLLFNASMPELNAEEDFNKNCRSYDEVEAVLGCYTQQKIYVYNIQEEELDGILELTSAHELLHAVYDRMSIAERDELKESLEKVYKDNQEILKDEISAYESAEQLEEIFVRAGTEIKELPEDLEKIYANIFNDRGAVVKYYEGYIGVFKKYEEEIESIEKRLKEINDEIDSKSEKYEKDIERLNNAIDDFNRCANTAGCFNSDTEFYNKREELISERDWLESLYDEIESLINQYNLDAEEYNDNVIIIERLQDIINSHVKINDI